MAQSFLCTITESGGTNGWMPPSFLIEYSGDNATVTHGWVGGPSSVQTQIRGNDNRRRLNYVLGDVGGSGGQRATMAFRLVHTMGSGQLRVYIDPVEYRNSYSASGACARMS